MIISVDEEKAFDKIQHVFFHHKQKKVLENVGLIHEKPTDNECCPKLRKKKVKVISLKSGMTRLSTIYILFKIYLWKVWSVTCKAVNS